MNNDDLNNNQGLQEQADIPEIIESSEELLQKANSEIQRLNENLNYSKKELAVLYEVSNAMRSSLKLNPILHTILTGVTAHSGLGFNRAILFLVNTHDRCLEPRTAIGPESGEHAQQIWEYISESNQHIDDLIKEDKVEQNIKSQSSLFDSIKDLKIPLKDNDNLLSNAYHDGSPTHITPDKISQYSDDIFLKHFHTNELVIVPLKAKDKVNGIIIADNIYTQKVISEEDLKMFIMLANQAGLAIENSRLYEIVMHKSHTDSLTSLWNHGFFQDKLTEEIEKSKENKKPLTLLIMDLDNFKILNDSCGHQNGDIILKEVSNLLKDSSREIDYVCRYGGEEFSIILTQTNKEVGYSIAERIRQKIEQHAFPAFSLYHEQKVTVSIGLATFPDDAENNNDLISQADRAMYKAKFSGKNQTYVAE
ncbi:MAG: sensor domain-containing diguanylate cyclase [Candidatus Omnitrophica bacterium]|nr:sensor domain-containing diguanylate cyclase [Candidatus Omnitrophota bacterium]MBU1996771.1 sensor domain-containing diguanylate cyclase [Candidatus Omnitrophota bacterium]MBU4333579.1 sensor domain-containing diguanylate cyclase [Candidatus Omnitrophota bacterium]